MKIIDLLNKIANGEELSPIIEYNEKRYFMVGNSCYEADDNHTLLEDVQDTNHIKDEIRIIKDTIEEPKKIEKICSSEYIVASTNMEQALNIRINKLEEKLNEVIYYINKGDSND